MRKDYRPELIAAILVLAFIAMWFTSCMTPQKATSYLKEKGLLADTCAANYPVNPSETLKPGTITIDSSITIDTLLNDHRLDSGTFIFSGRPTNRKYFFSSPSEFVEGALILDTSLSSWLPNSETYELPQPKTILKTIRIVERRIDTLTQIVVDSAKLAAANRKISLLEKQLKDTEAELYKAEDKAKDRGKTSLYSIVGNGLLLLLLGFILAKKRKA